MSGLAASFKTHMYRLPGSIRLESAITTAGVPRRNAHHRVAVAIPHVNFMDLEVCLDPCIIPTWWLDPYATDRVFPVGSAGHPLGFFI
jgi:hypothetical protein